MPRLLSTYFRVTVRLLAWTNVTTLGIGAMLPAFAQQGQQSGQKPPITNPGQNPGQIPPPGGKPVPVKPGDTKKADIPSIGQQPGTVPPGTGPQENERQPEGGPKTPLLRKETLVNYTGVNDPSSQRIRRSPAAYLPLYGYNYFEPARQAIEAYRLRFQRLLGPDYPVPKDLSQLPNGDDQTSGLNGFNGQNGNGGGTGSNINGQYNGQNTGPNSSPNSGQGTGRGIGNQRQPTRPPTKEELDSLTRLTPAQRADLMARARLDKLTDDERQRYGAALDASVLTESSILNIQDDDQSSNLTDSQKLDLLVRLRDNLLTEDEKIRYRKFLYGKQGGPSSIPQGGTGTILGTSQDGQLPQLPQDQQPFRRAGYSDAYQTPQTASAYNAVIGPMEAIWKGVIASAPTNYQLAAGDKITYRFSTPTMQMREMTIEVDTTGGMTVPDIGRVIVRGQTLAQAETAIQTRLQRFYRSAQVSLSLKELRTMAITVTGESFAPGTYMVPAVATAFNMLYATGGPTDNGSLRQIEVRRKGKVAGIIDFYKFFLTGDQTSADIQLEPGDVIFIPGQTGRVTVTGEVRNSYVFEVTPNESLKETLQFAGGVKATGVTQRVQVTTLQPGAARKIETVDVSQVQSAAKVPVYDGDTVEVFSVREELTNVVTVDGAVDLPGQYAMTPGMKVADLVKSARGLLSDAYPTLAHLYRWNQDNTLTLVPINLEKAIAGDVKENVAINRWDRLTVYARQEITWTGRRDVTVRGAIKNAGIYYRSDNMTVRDLLMVAGGTNPSAYMERAYLLHQRPDGTFAYDIVDLTKAIKDDPKHNALIQDHDILAVYKADEAKFTPDHAVSIHGEVNAPGKYPRGDQMRLSELLGIAGGLTGRAGSTILVAHSLRPENEEAVKVTFAKDTGVATPDPVLQDGDVVTIQGRTLIETPGVVSVVGAVNHPGPVILNGPKVRLSDVIKLSGGLKEEAFPQGIEFKRSSDTLATTQQRQMMDVLNTLNNILNQADYSRALAASDVEKARALKEVSNSGSTLSIPGFSQPQVAGTDASLGLVAKDLSNRELVSRPRILTLDDLAPKGNVAVDLAAAMQKPGGDDDILMLDGDTVTVPVRPTTVQVVGAVMESRGVLFREGANLEYYMEHAGGFSRDAAKDRILVIRLGGGLLPVQKVKKFLPGDVIMVPTKPMAEPIQKRTNQFDGLFRSLTNSALIVLVAKKLLGL